MFDLNRLKNIELVIFDVDGTLVNDEGQIGERSKDLIMKLKKLGVIFSFASGRLHSALVPLAEELRIYSPFISLDGSAIKSVESKQFVYRSFLKDKQVKKAMSLFRTVFSKDCSLSFRSNLFYRSKILLFPN